MGTLRIAIDPAVSADAPEIKYVFRTLLRAAGFSWEFCWSDEGTSAEIYYGRLRPGVEAGVRIDACGLSFATAAQLEPEGFRESAGLPFLEFKGGGPDPLRRDERSCAFSNDIVFACYWLLTGAREPHYARDRWDNLDLTGSFFLRHSIQQRPAVSLYAAFLREFFQARGHEPLRFPAAGSFVFTHDVDYPQIIRWIECLRLAASRGFRGAGSIAGVLSGRNHFWKFADWVEFEREYGTRPAFYFMARRGSLYQYAMGTPDAFYDIRRPEFRELFRYLEGEGCEIGLHASYHAHRMPGQVGREKSILEEAAGVRVEGGRHHYWHLDPAAPNDTLLEHERAGLSYDSSLGLEFYPGFRRGICHPFRVFHPRERREIQVLQLPPAWMDDHFDRRLTRNGIQDCEGYAAGLMRVAAEMGGITMVDYHARGMNGDFYPRYGPWLKDFLEKRRSEAARFAQPVEVVRSYRQYEAEIERRSLDRTAMEDKAAAGLAAGRV
jgi:hypothetical protein